MRVIKPSWLTHGGELKDFEVYSCDVSPDGQRLVTAAGDGYVRIWSTNAIYHADEPEYAEVPRQLASLSNHSGTIHAVRFSPNGRYVASGADDRIVCVYTLEDGPPSHAVFGSEEPPPIENWRTIRRLIGHDNDVQDLAWSHDSSILVSVGLDSRVVVWSGFTFDKLKTISNHQSLVKGITFDPANKYFATASDDRTIRVFRFTSPTPNTTAHDSMNNFVLEQTITAPFVNSPLTTYFRRPSWTPDGTHIIAANAVNGPVTCAAIIKRGEWESEISFIGHEAPVEVCRCSPRLYARSPGNNNANNASKNGSVLTTSVIATASDDKALSIWTTNNARPLVVLQDLANKAFTDLAWSPDGLCLFATALDGTVIALRFDESGADLGTPLGLEENEKCLAKFGGNKRGAGIVESTSGLMLEELSRAGEQKNVEGRMGALMGDHHHDVGVGQQIGSGSLRPATSATGDQGQKDKEKETAEKEKEGQAGPADASANATPTPASAAKIERLKQKPTYTKEGKKRIQPMLISSSGGAASSLPQSRLITEQSTTYATPAQGGKFEPESVLNLSRPFDRLPKGGLPALLFGNKRKFAEDDEDGTSNTIARKVLRASVNGATPILRHDDDGTVRPAEEVSRGGEGAATVPEFIRPAVVNPALAASQLRLAVPKVKTHITRAIDASGNPTDPTAKNTFLPRADIVLEARNPTPPSARRTSTTAPLSTTTHSAHEQEAVRITLVRADQLLWQDFLERPVLLATGNKCFWAAACEDGTIYTWTPAGRRLLNALQLEAAPVILECMDAWLLAITAAGMCYVWNLVTLAAPHPPVSLAPVLDAATKVIRPEGVGSKVPCVNAARINSEGRIVVVLSNGDGYSYNPALYTWTKMSETWWACSSQYWNTTDSSVGDLQATSSSSATGPAPAAMAEGKGARSRPLGLSAGIIPFMERNTTTEVLVHGRGFFLQRLIKFLLSGQREGYESFESCASVAHLENRVAAALSLGAKDEFRVYLSMYAKRLGAEGLKAKAEELLESILGGIFEDEEQSGGKGTGRNQAPEGSAWMEGSETLCGWDRKELLKEVVLALGKHRDLQRVTVPYAQLLGVVGDGQGGSEGGSMDDDVMIS